MLKLEGFGRLNSSGVWLIINLIGNKNAENAKDKFSICKSLSLIYCTLIHSNLTSCAGWWGSSLKTTTDNIVSQHKQAYFIWRGSTVIEPISKKSNLLLLLCLGDYEQLYLGVISVEIDKKGKRAMHVCKHVYVHCISFFSPNTNYSAS